MRDVQVAASMRRGDVGIHALNTAIKGALNPSADDRFTVELRKRPFTVGDRVMQLRNDYAKGVYNGEVGTVCWVGTRLNDEGRNVPAIKVDYSGYEAAYTDADRKSVVEGKGVYVRVDPGGRRIIKKKKKKYKH